jgi:hypothetical protein
LVVKRKFEILPFLGETAVVFVENGDEQIVPFETRVILPLPFDRDGKKT